MSRLTVALLATGLILLAGNASAYVWRCHAPTGDIWTSQPKPSDDCEEYDFIFNPSAAPPPVQNTQPVPTAPVQYAPVPPPPAPPAYVYPYAYPYPYPYPYAYYPYYPRYYYGGPGLSLVLPPFVFEFGPRFGHGPHLRPHHFRWR
jgi:hypothetical protein